MIDMINTRRSVRKFTQESLPEDAIDRVLEAAMNAPSAMNEQAWQFVILSGDRLEDFLAINKNSPKGAPAGILVCGDLEAANGDYWIQDCSAATENILLAAHSLGLGSVWTTVFPDAVGPIRSLLGLPDSIIPFSYTPVGHAQKKPLYKSRYDRAKVHYNRW